MVKLEEFQELISKADELARETNRREVETDRAKMALSNARDQATGAWDQVYETLVLLAAERKNDQSFNSSKLGYILRAEVEKAKRDGK